ncbi:MAG TPA: flagellar hook-associated protein FlgK [Albitalea sp.]
MNLGSRALFANYAALQATGNNIANANTKGYSRQTVELEAAGGQFSGAGFFGKGVNVTTVARAHNVFLTREAASSRGFAAADATRSEQLKRLELVFPTGEAGVGHASGQFLNAFVDVASRPQDLAARQVVLGRAADVASRFRAAGRQLDTLQANVNSDLKAAVATVNTLAQRVADINAQITLAQGSGHQPNDLLDLRDQLISDISAQVQVTTIAANDGSMSVFIGGGQRLVLGAEASTLATMSDEYDPAKLRLALSDSSGLHPLPDNLVTGGAVAGLLRFQRVDLADARNLLGQMAVSLAAAVNTQQALGLDLGQPPGAGAPIFGTGRPLVQPSDRNALDASGNPVASYLDATGVRVPSIGLTITDSSRLRASSYEVRPDAGTPGNYLVTRQSDGQQTSVAPGGVIDGFRLDVTGPLPAPGDRFMLHPVGTAALNMQRVLDAPAGIAAASPVTASVAAGNTGTMSVAGVRAASTTLDPTLTATMSFTDDNGAYSWELRDAANTLVSSGTGAWAAGQSIDLNGFELQLNGVPRSGDSVVVAPTVYTSTNNGNARALTDLRDALMVAQPSGSGATITDAYANVMTEVGVRVQSAGISAEMSAAVARDAQASVSEKSGVNLDEEAARLIQYQQSYQAAAKMLQVAQSIFDSLLQVAAR